MLSAFCHGKELTSSTWWLFFQFGGKTGSRGGYFDAIFAQTRHEGSDSAQDGSALVFPICPALSSHPCQAALSAPVQSCVTQHRQGPLGPQIMQQVLLELCFIALCKEDGCQIHCLRSSFTSQPVFCPSSSAMPLCSVFSSSFPQELMSKLLSLHCAEQTRFTADLAAANNSSGETLALKFLCKAQLSLRKQPFSSQTQLCLSSAASVSQGNLLLYCGLG